MKSEILIFNGKRIKGQNLKFKHLKRPFLYGDGIFETMVSINKKIFRFENHWERMENGSKICNLEIPKKDEIEKIIMNNIGREKYYIRITLWRKKPETFSPENEKESSYLIIIRKFKGYPEKFYREGISCIISEKVRRNEKSQISKIKSINFIENIIMKFEAREKNVDDTIVLNTSDFISEGSVSNIFFLKKDKIYTPSINSGCLDGITRKVVIEICEKEGIEIKEGFFKKEFLKDCYEVFLTNTLMGIMPVREIKGFFKNNKFKITKFLIEKYDQILKEETE